MCGECFLWWPTAENQTWGPDCKVQIIFYNKNHGARWFRSSMLEYHSGDFLGGLTLSQGTRRNSSGTQQDSLLSRKEEN